MLIPSDNIPDSKLFSYDKIGHLGVFAILSFLLAYGFYKQSTHSRVRNKTIAHSLTISIVYSTSLEFLQKFIPGRAFDLYDIVANTTGVLAGLLIFSVFRRNSL